MNEEDRKNRFKARIYVVVVLVIIAVIGTVTGYMRTHSEDDSATQATTSQESGT